MWLLFLLWVGLFVAAAEWLFGDSEGVLAGGFLVGLVLWWVARGVVQVLRDHAEEERRYQQYKGRRERSRGYSERYAEETGDRLGVADSNTRVREAIPERVRHEVWRRDQGRCVDCGSRERLEFDHTIPLSKGGSSTARNLELRCERCNRAKGGRI